MTEENPTNYPTKKTSVDPLSNVGTKGGEPSATRTSTTPGNVPGQMENLTPEEVRQKAKDAVGRVVASATGTLEGYAEQADPKVMGQATRKVAETVRETATTAKDQYQTTRSELGIQGKTTPSNIDNVNLQGTSGPGFKDRAKGTMSSAASSLKEGTAHTATNVKDKSKQAYSSYKESIQGKSPEEVRRMAHDAAARATASMTGSVEGVAEYTDPNVAKQAVQKVGESVTEAAKGVKEGIKKPGTTESGTTGTTSGEYSTY